MDGINRIEFAFTPRVIGTEEQTVDARELHVKLESKAQFADWIKDRVRQAQLVEGQDFVSFRETVKREIGAAIRIDYALTLDSAKHIAMLEGTEIGSRIRRYFIEVEKKLRQAQWTVADIIANPEAAVAVLSELIEKKKALEAETAKAKLLEDRLGEAEGWATVKRVGIALQATKPMLSQVLLNKVSCSNAGKLLSKQSRAKGVEIKKVYDSNYGSVNSYSKEVWRDVFGVDIDSI